MEDKNYNLSKKIAIFLKQKREDLNLTQEKLAEISGIEYKHIQNLESFKRLNDPKISTLLKLSKGLGIKIEDIIKEIFENQSGDNNKTL